MPGRGKYPVEVREWAVRLVLEHRRDYPSQWAAISSIASKCGMTTETLRKWVRRAEVDSGGRAFPWWGFFAASTYLDGPQSKGRSSALPRLTPPSVALPGVPLAQARRARLPVVPDRPSAGWHTRSRRRRTPD